MLAFKKMHGLGNDFVVLDARAEPIDLPESRIRLIGDRHFGIGFDQLMVIEAPKSQDADIFLRIYNPDGSEAEACGTLPVKTRIKPHTTQNAPVRENSRTGGTP